MYYNNIIIFLCDPLLYFTLQNNHFKLMRVQVELYRDIHVLPLIKAWITYLDWVRRWIGSGFWNWTLSFSSWHARNWSTCFLFQIILSTAHLSLLILTVDQLWTNPDMPKYVLIRWRSITYHIMCRLLSIYLYHNSLSLHTFELGLYNFEAWNWKYLSVSNSLSRLLRFWDVLGVRGRLHKWVDKYRGNYVSNYCWYYM